MNNAIYYHVAYVVVAVAVAAYAGSLWWRGRDLDRREVALRRGAPERR